MNSIIISQILEKYNISPYYKSNEYICINDDRLGRIVSFKLYQEKNEIIANFNEAHQSYPLNTSNYKSKIITSFEDFKIKWKEYYNFNS